MERFKSYFWHFFVPVFLIALVTFPLIPIWNNGPYFIFTGVSYLFSLAFVGPSLFEVFKDKEWFQKIPNTYRLKFHGFCTQIFPYKRGLLWFFFFGQLLLLWNFLFPVHEYVLGGKIPLVDARGYLEGATSITLTGELSKWAGRRPLNHIFFGGLLKLAHYDFNLVFIILAFFFAFIGTLLKRSFNQIFGSLGAIYILLCFFHFIRPYFGSFLSENFGLFFSSLGLLFFILSTHRNKFNYFYPIFVFFIGFTLAGRSGTFLVLPFLMFLPLLGKQTKWRDRIIIIALSSVLGGTGYYSNNLIRSHLDLQGDIFSNANLTIYGVIRGGKGWTYLSKEHPEVHNLPISPEKEAKVKGLIKHYIIAEPLMVVKGLFKGLKLFVLRYSTFLPKPFHVFEIFLHICGFIYFFRRFRYGDKNDHFFLSPFEWGVLVLHLGNFIFAPMIAQDGEQRVFAATIFYTPIFYLFGLNLFIENFQLEKFQPKIRFWPITISFLGLALIIWSLWSPMIKEVGTTQPGFCAENQRQVIFPFIQNSSVTLNELDWNINDLLRISKSGNQLEMKDFFLSKDPYTLLPIIDLLKKKYYQSKIQGRKKLKKGIYRGCLDKEKKYYVLSKSEYLFPL